MFLRKSPSGKLEEVIPSKLVLPDSTVLDIDGIEDGILLVRDGTSIAGAEYPKGALHLDFTPIDSAALPYNEGCLSYDVVDHTLDLKMDFTDVALSIGQEIYIRVVNKTGATIPNGSALYPTGAQGNRPTVGLAIATGEPQTWAVGVATHDIPNNEEGLATIIGRVGDVDTRTFVDGALLFLSSTVAGWYQLTRPTGTNTVWTVGVALNTTVNGSIMVNPFPPTQLQYLHDVDDGDPATAGRILVANGTHWTAATALHLEGIGSPEGSVAAPTGSTYRNLSGGAGTTFYVKESSPTTTTGWIAK